MCESVRQIQYKKRVLLIFGHIRIYNICAYVIILQLKGSQTVRLLGSLFSLALWALTETKMCLFVM